MIVPFQISCGECAACRRGHTNACTSVPFRSSYGLKPVCGVEYGGGLSDLIRVPFADHMLVRQPKGHAMSQTAGLADGATDGFSSVANWLKQRPGEEVLVIGGFGQSLSMFAVQAAVSRGARRVVYVDDDPARLAKAKSLGAEVHEAPKGLAMEFDRKISHRDRRRRDRRVHPARIPLGGAERHLPAHVWRFHRRPRRCRCATCTASASPFASAASMCAPNLPECVDHVERGHFHPEHVITRRVRLRMRMKRSAIPPSASPLFAMAWTSTSG